MIQISLFKYEQAKMAGVTKVEIFQSVEELHELLIKQKTAVLP